MTEYHTVEGQEHLGGYIPGGDPATITPALWTWLVESLHARTVLDVGCGEGLAMRHFRGLPQVVWAAGIDGVAQHDSAIFQHDYTRGNASIDFLPLVFPEAVDDSPVSGWPYRQVDLAWACEFVEHVEQRYLPHVLHTFSYARTVALTHALPGQPGYHHVNCQPREYWLGAMAAIGFELMPVVTDIGRSKCEPWQHFARTGLIFRRLS